MGILEASQSPPRTLLDVKTNKISSLGAGLEVKQKREGQKLKEQIETCKDDWNSQ